MKEIQANSTKMVEWIYWMVLDILLSNRCSIEYRYVYVDKKKKDVVVRRRLMARAILKKYERVDACVYFEDEKIFISPNAEDKALCLFHECMEILFSGWKDEYYVPKRWGLKEDEDPILNLEDATWKHLSEDQKAFIKAFLPKEP